MDVASLKITESSGTAELWVRVRPRAHRSAVKGVVDGALELAIAAAPKEGEANAEVVRFLAEVIGVPKRNVSIIRGESSRHKRVRVVGVSAVAIAACLARDPPC